VQHVDLLERGQEDRLLGLPILRAVDVANQVSFLPSCLPQGIA
jgi:hypothetical protein